MAGTALVAYLSGLCSPAFTATQYALLSSLAAVGRTLVASSGGVLADKLGWVPFFLLTTVATIPALCAADLDRATRLQRLTRERESYICVIYRAIEHQRESVAYITTL